MMDAPVLADGADEIAIGAENIAARCFNKQLSPRQVYRLAEEGSWPFFRLRGKLAMRPTAARAEITRREAAAVTSGKAA
jgi:hypothetical protein